MLALHLLAALCPAHIPWQGDTRSDLSAAERQGVLSHLDRHASVTGVTIEMVRNNPGRAAGLLSHQIDTLINDPTKAAAPVRDVFANRPAFAGGIGAAAGFGGRDDGGDGGVGAGVGPDGATSVGLDPESGYLPVTWGDDSDGDGVGNAEEAALGTDAENPNSRPTNAVLYVHALRRLAEEQALAMQQKRRDMLSLLAGHDLALTNRSENNWLSKITFGAREFNANAPEFFFGDFSRLGDRLDNAGIQGGAGFVSGGAAGALTGAGVGAFFSGVGAGPGALTGGGIGALGGLAEGSVAGFLSSPDMSFEDSLKQGALIGTFNGVLGGASTPLVLRSAGIAAKTTPKWPKTAQEMDDLLKMPGQKIPDGPTTLGRDKTVWRPNKDTKITLEKHPYDTTAPDWHKGPHWHLDTPGIKPHQRYVPGDDIPGY